MLGPCEPYRLFLNCMFLACALQQGVVSGSYLPDLLYEIVPVGIIRFSEPQNGHLESVMI